MRMMGFKFTLQFLNRGEITLLSSAFEPPSQLIRLGLVIIARGKRGGSVETCLRFTDRGENPSANLAVYLRMYSFT